MASAIPFHTNTISVYDKRERERSTMLMIYVPLERMKITNNNKYITIYFKKASAHMYGVKFLKPYQLNIFLIVFMKLRVSKFHIFLDQDLSPKFAI